MGDLLNRTILVRGFEGDERDLRLMVHPFGRVEEMDIQRIEQHTPPTYFDVGSFIGSTSKFERGANRISDPTVSESETANVAENTACVAQRDTQSPSTVLFPRSAIFKNHAPPSDEGFQFHPADWRVKRKALECCESVVFKDCSSDQVCWQTSQIDVYSERER